MMPEPYQNHTAAVLDTDDRGALLLAAAVAERARADAAQGDTDAAAWLDELRQHRPKSSRWFIPDADRLAA